MPLFGPKEPCPYCGALVKQPREGKSTACPSCGNPGPWAPEEEHATHRAMVAARQAQQAQSRYEADVRRHEQLSAALNLAPIQAPGFIAQKGEDAYYVAPAQLAEWKKGRGHYEGAAGIRAVSVKVPGTKSVRAYYGGLSQRRYVPGEEGWTVTNAGTAVVTNKRVVFRGGSKNMEWSFAKLVGADVDENNGAIVLQVSNRQRSNVLAFEDLEMFVIVFEAAVARFQDRPAPTLPPPTSPGASDVPPMPPLPG